MKIMLEQVHRAFARGEVPALDTWERIPEWLKESGLKPENIVMQGSYIVKGRGDDGWYLVARRFVHDVHGKRIKTKIGDGYQKTIYVTTPVKTPPTALLPQENPS